jgi:hypothetical protein
MAPLLLPALTSGACACGWKHRGWAPAAGPTTPPRTCGQTVTDACSQRLPKCWGSDGHREETPPATRARQPTASRTAWGLRSSHISTRAGTPPTHKDYNLGKTGHSGGSSHVQLATAEHAKGFPTLLLQGRRSCCHNCLLQECATPDRRLGPAAAATAAWRHTKQPGPPGHPTRHPASPPWPTPSTQTMLSPAR